MKHGLLASPFLTIRRRVGRYTGYQPLHRITQWSSASVCPLESVLLSIRRRVDRDTAYQSLHGAAQWRSPRACLLAAAFTMLAACGSPPPSGLAWAVDPAVPGADLPPAGRSLFDSVIRDGIPFPFAALVERVESQTQTRVRRVLIPLGRSLQRSSAQPDFFRFPRVVVAVTNEGPGNLYLKDRLFLGYQEKASLIEVISYNETAGRFEFQLVRDYREGGRPVVRYARRKICLECHQNQAPLFARPLWDETNANPGIAALLHAQGAQASAAPVGQGVDNSYFVDNAVHRANLLAVLQRIWRQAPAALRGALLQSLLAQRLSVTHSAPLPSSEWRAFWRGAWPRGLQIPNPEIPNRDPLRTAELEAPSEPAALARLLGREQMRIPSGFEPRSRRAPLEIWRGSEAELQRSLEAWAEAVPEPDRRMLDELLSRPSEPARVETVPCEFSERRVPGGFDRLTFSCGAAGGDGLLYFAAGRFQKGTITSGPWRDAVIRDAVVSGRRVAMQLAGARRGDVMRLAGLRLDRGRATASLETYDDGRRLAAAIARIGVALEDPAFRRENLLGALFAQLGGPPAGCCAGAAPLAAPEVE